MKLSIGITAAEDFFQPLLSTLGIHYTALAAPLDSGQLAAYPVIIAAGGTVRRHAPLLEDYVRQGGQLLIESESAGRIKAFAALPAGSGRPWQGFSDTLTGSSLISGILQSAHHSLGRGSVLILPRGFRRLLQQRRVRRKRFPRVANSDYPSERVAALNRSAMLRLLEAGLRGLFHRCDLPFAHLWPFPGAAQGVAGFRIDTDFATTAQLQDLRQLCRETGIPASWFVETASARDRMAFFAEMTDQEIGYHCFCHQLPHNSHALARDLQQGLRIMSMAGLHPRGYAAPYGEWRAFLPKLLPQYGLTWSSEFALAYDALPFFPSDGSGRFRLLQIPIHPVSCNRLAHAGIGGSAAADYYRAVIRRNRRQRLPAFLYHHPAQKGGEVFRELFTELKGDAGMAIMSLGNYAVWWQRRASMDWHAEWRENQLTLHCSTPGEVSLCLEHPGGRVELHDCAGLLPPRRLAEDGLYREENEDPALGKYSNRMWRQDLLWHYRRWAQ